MLSLQEVFPSHGQLREMRGCEKNSASPWQRGRASKIKVGGNSHQEHDARKSLRPNLGWQRHSFQTSQSVIQKNMLSKAQSPLVGQGTPGLSPSSW